MLAVTAAKNESTLKVLFADMQDCIAEGQLSNCQLETVIYAFMRFEKRLPNRTLHAVSLLCLLVVHQPTCYSC